MTTGVRAVFFDVGGVLLTNGWDHEARSAAVERFGLDGADFEDRHQAVADAWEVGQLTLEAYLDRTVFHRARDFDRGSFVAFMRSRSRPHEDAIALARALAARGEVFLATLNNESLELNRYRITTYGLTDIFSAFFSSCYLGARKPEEAIYRRALGITQQDPGGCLFIDDRALNVECAAGVGMRTIHHDGDVDRLRRELEHAGVAP